MKSLLYILIFIGALTAYWWGIRNRTTKQQRVLATVVLGAVALLAFLFVDFFPRPAGALAAFLVMGSIGLALIVAFIYVVTRVQFRKIQRKVAKDRDLALKLAWYRPIQDGVPQAVVDRVAELQAVGFRRLIDFRSPAEQQGSLLFRDKGSIYAEVNQLPPGKHPASGELIVELVSELTRGTVITCTPGLGLHLVADELLQVFPGAATEDLLRQHERALSLVETHGITVEPSTEDEVLGRFHFRLATQLSATVTASRRDFVRELQRTMKGQHIHVGALADNSTMRERVEVIASHAQGGAPRPT